MIDFITLILIKSFAILLVVFIIGSLLFRNPAVNRTFVYRLGFLSILLLPFLSLIIPQYDIFLFNLIPSLDISLTEKVATSSIQSIGLADEQINQISLLFYIVIGWVVGSSVVLSRIIIGEYLTYKIQRDSSPIIDTDLDKLIYNIKHELHLNQSIETKISTQASVPFVTGLFKQTIILPYAFLMWTKDKQKMVLVHEIAHIKRNDRLWFLLSSIATVLYWFNPLVWVCRKKIIIDTEIACDNYVLSKGYNAKSYAEHLLNIAKDLKYNLFVSPINLNMARKTQLEGRLMSILKEQKRVLKVKPSLAAMVIVVTIMFLLPLAGIQLFAGETNPQAAMSPMELNNEYGAAEKSDKEKEDEKYPKPDDFVALTTMPEMIKMVNPEYPKEAKKKGIEGDVWIKALVIKDGTVNKVVVSKTSGNELLDKSAMTAAYQNIFKPGLQKDKPVACWITYKVTFELGDDEDKDTDNDDNDDDDK